jgi:hypothetical protein
VFVIEIKIAANKRVVGLVSQWSLPEPTGSGFGLFVLGVIVPIPPHTQNISSS